MNDELINRRVLGRYRVLRQLAVGGMGVIYLGRNEGAAGFAKPVVIKRIDPTYMDLDDEAETYFVNEAKILAQLRHPGIVSVIDFGREADGAYVMVLEYVHGFTLMQWLRFHRKRGERFPADEAIHVVRRVLEALEYAHGQGIVHRDVTPSNVLIDVDGHIKLADFGIASIRSNDDDSKAQKLRGKIAYLAPELISGDQAATASDIYSAALVLHELLVGTNEFRAPSVETTLYRVATHVPTRVSERRDDTALSLDDVLAAALAKRPRDRYPSADALAEDLRLVQRGLEAEVERSLKQRVRSDFEGELPLLLGIEPLDARAAALNEAPRTDPPVPVAQRGRGRRALLAAVAVAAVVTIGSGAAFALFAAPRPPAHAPSRYIVVERNAPTATLDSPHATALPASAAASVDPAPNPPAPPDPAAEPAPPTRDEARLTRAFASRRREVEACYERHTVELSGSPRVEIAFEIARNGKVESIALAPAELGSTALGHCIVRVARSVRFGRQDGPLRFTIPVTASVVRR